MNMETMITKFILIHFIVGSLRGFYRYLMIDKHQYNYYDPSMKLIGKLAHNLLYGTINSTTFLISVCLSVLAFLTL